MSETREQHIERNKNLIAKFPFLMPRNVFTDKVPEDYDYSYNALEDAIPEGWWKTFGEQWCEDLLEELNRQEIDPSIVRIDQAKEKYGEIRVYLSGEPRDWVNHEFAWECISTHTCGKCGKFPAKLRTDGWIWPLCDECYDKEHQNWSKEEKEKYTEESHRDGKLEEYIYYKSFGEGKEILGKIDMKPYYKKIGFDYKPEDLK